MLDAKRSRSGVRGDLKTLIGQQKGEEKIRSCGDSVVFSLKESQLQNF